MSVVEIPVHGETLFQIGSVSKTFWGARMAPRLGR